MNTLEEVDVFELPPELEPPEDNSDAQLPFGDFRCRFPDEHDNEDEIGLVDGYQEFLRENREEYLTSDDF